MTEIKCDKCNTEAIRMSSKKVKRGIIEVTYLCPKCNIVFEKYNIDNVDINDKNNNDKNNNRKDISIRLICIKKYPLPMLMAEELKKFNTWVDEYKHIIKPCCLCDGDSYDLVFEPVEIRLFQGGGLVIGGKSELFIFHALNCNICGNTNFISRKSIVG